MPDEILLNEAAYAVWQTVHNSGADGIEINEIASGTGVHQSQVSATINEAASAGFFRVVKRDREQLIQNEGVNELVHGRGLPEQMAALFLQESNGEVALAQLVEWARINDIAVNEVFKWGAARGWIDRVKGEGGPIVKLTQTGRHGIRALLSEPDLEALHIADIQSKESRPFYLDQIVDEKKRGVVRSRLANRPGLAKIKKRTERVIYITGNGAEALRSHVRVLKERSTLTPEDLESGAWREIKLRPYDVSLPAKDIYPAKIHPLRKIIEQTRRAFLEMGFAEVASPMIESAFWNFDALFQPQDHPARDMQDTFYMRDPATAPLPGEKGDKPPRKKRLIPFFARPEIVDQVRRTHEDGWETGSEGWGYTWSPERSRQVVLRTHTTAATIRALAANPNPPGKFFCVGWTYRNETISFKHLPVFHQVDGIILDEEANLASLLGTLQEFYTKMGFGRVKFKPAFYPYTEPSVDVVVYMESRKKWLEMGGAGIFRPEVTLPLGCKWPVLAWGLGIERLAMLRFGLSDIRDLYRANLDALEEVPLCR
jgi:phenylalanyl-tRNA synthetase alpha chain